MNLHPSQWLDASGLFISIVGSGLLLRLTIPVSSKLIYDKEAKAYDVSTIISYKISVPHWKVWLLRSGPVLLFVGFLLQLIAVFLEG